MNQPATDTITDLPNGILPSQELVRLIHNGGIKASEPISDDQIQPASLDLRLGATAWRVRASFLPGKQRTVEQCLDGLVMHQIDLSEGAVLEKGCVYIVPLLESVNLVAGLSATGNPKSSTGRIDVFTRLITDHGHEFDQVRAGYSGQLYAEIAPRTFSILVRKSSRLSQLRLRHGTPQRGDDSHLKLHQSQPLVDIDLGAEDIKNGIPISVDLNGNQKTGLIGYRAKSHAGLIDVDNKDFYDVAQFWEPVYAQKDGGLVLDPGEFYILASKEAVRIPIDHAAEMIAYDTLVGEFRVHYAGFFDPGFGDAAADGHGTRAVLEVRSFEVPFIINHGQVIGRLMYEPLTYAPDKIYGQDLKSNYQKQGLKLSKHFKQSSWIA